MADHFSLTTHCALCGSKLLTIRSGLAPLWCGYDLGPDYERDGDQTKHLCKCETKTPAAESTGLPPETKGKTDAP